MLAMTWSAPCWWWPVSGGDGLSLPAVRVPLDAVSGWWIDGGKKLSSGGNWFFGVAVLLDLGN